MRWDKKSKSFVSIGKIGLGTILGQPVNKFIEGYVQIEKGRTGSGINIFPAAFKRTMVFFEL